MTTRREVFKLVAGAVAAPKELFAAPELDLVTVDASWSTGNAFTTYALDAFPSPTIIMFLDWLLGNGWHMTLLPGMRGYRFHFPAWLDDVYLEILKTWLEERRPKDYVFEYRRAEK